MKVKLAFLYPLTWPDAWLDQMLLLFSSSITYNRMKHKTYPLKPLEIACSVSWMPGGCSQLLIHWVLLCWLLLWYCLASTTCGNIPKIYIYSHHYLRLFALSWHVICRWTKIIFQNQVLETVCLCLETSLCLFPHKYAWPLLEKKVLKKKSGKQFRHSCFCFSLTYLMFLLVPLGERKRLSFCIRWLFPSVSLPPSPHFSHLLLCMNACCTIYFFSV